MTETINAVLTGKIDALAESIVRLEGYISREIQELKTEQIGDLRKHCERLADDQRRAWEAIRSLELAKASNSGGVRVIHTILMGMSAMLGASLATLITHLLK